MLFRVAVHLSFIHHYQSPLTAPLKQRQTDITKNAPDNCCFVSPTEIVELKQNCLCVYQGGRILKFVISFLPCSLSLYSLLQLPSTKRKKSLCKTCPFLKSLLWGIFLRYITIVNLAATMCMLANILFTWHRQLRNFCYNDQWREICTTKLYHL